MMICAKRPTLPLRTKFHKIEIGLGKHWWESTLNEHYHINILHFFSFLCQVPVGFKSNGKPGRIYHWNIPVLKKILGNNQGRNPNSRHHDNIDELIDIKDIPTWTEPWENEALDKSLIKFSSSAAAALDHVDKIQKKKSPTFYAPIKAKKSAQGGKYYASNGKPQSFYVIEKSQKSLKPIHHHALIP